MSSGLESLAAFFQSLANALTPLPDADTTGIQTVISDLQTLLPPTAKEIEMTNPDPTTGYVQILASDWNSFVSELGTVATGLKTYIAALQANQAGPLADETQFKTDLAALEALVPTPVAAPTVTATTGGPGADGGGDTVTVTGTGFFGGTSASVVSAVNFGSVPATSFSVESDTSLTAVSPAGSTGTVDVTVVTPAGTSEVSAADQFSYA